MTSSVVAPPQTLESPIASSIFVTHFSSQTLSHFLCAPLSWACDGNATVHSVVPLQLNTVPPRIRGEASTLCPPPLSGLGPQAVRTPAVAKVSMAARGRTRVYSLGYCGILVPTVYLYYSLAASPSPLILAATSLWLLLLRSHASPGDGHPLGWELGGCMSSAPFCDPC